MQLESSKSELLMISPIIHRNEITQLDINISDQLSISGRNLGTETFYLTFTFNQVMTEQCEMK